MGKPILVLDFDGVIHEYKSKWTTAAEVLDGPVPGAIEFITKAVEYFNIFIMSSRSKDKSGVVAMQDALMRWGLSDEVFNKLEWANEKPAAFLTIDDRAITFEGTWPDVQELLKFKPWNKR